MPRILDSTNVELCTQEEIIACIEQDDIKKLKSLNYTLDMFYKEVEGAPLCHHLLNKNATKLLKFLLENQLNVEVKDKDNATMLHYAHTPEQIKLLLEKGANIEAADIKGETLLHKLSYKCLYKKDALVYLLARGANLDAQNAAGNTPLHIAAAAGDQEIIRILMKEGASLSIQNNRAQLPVNIGTAITNNYMKKIQDQMIDALKDQVRNLEQENKTFRARLEQLEKIAQDLREILGEKQQPFSKPKVGFF